jgi:transcriptional regulator GlxA family with amidase domain
VPINGPHDLRETTRGSDVEIVQLKPGKLMGPIKHFCFGYEAPVQHPDPRTGAGMMQRLTGIISGIEHKSTTPSERAADFLQRSITESLIVGLTSTLPPASAQSYTGAPLVSETEDYVDAAGGRPVHISELCSAVKVSWRTLHRAFTDTLGVGPAAYLRRRRLSAIRLILSRCDPATISIGDLAFEYGFPETGRFAAYYRAHFGDAPSEKLRSGSVSTRSLR